MLLRPFGEQSMLWIHVQVGQVGRDVARVSLLARDEVPPSRVVALQLVVHSVDERRHQRGDGRRGRVDRGDVFRPEAHELGEVAEPVPEVRLEAFFVDHLHGTRALGLETFHGVGKETGEVLGDSLLGGEGETYIGMSLVFGS